MKLMKPRLAGMLLASVATAAFGAEVQRFEVGGPLRYVVVAAEPRLNREVTGPIVHSVRGVPAEPVDSMVYDGQGSVPIEGELFLEVDPIRDVGFIEARWSDEHGEWLYLQERFIHPEHSSGVRLGKSMFEVESFLNEGITHNIYLHGDTQAGMPVLPTVFNVLAMWGPASVFLNGEPFVNPYELPAPQWLGHLMVTEGVRHPDGTVRTHDGEIYDPSRGAEGGVESGDLEVHLVFHDERFPRTTNVPSLFSFFYHLVFEDVFIQVVQADQLLSIDFLEDPGGEDPGEDPGSPAGRRRPDVSRDPVRRR